MKGNFWIGLPPRRFAPPLLFREGSGNLKLDKGCGLKTPEVNQGLLREENSRENPDNGLDRCGVIVRIHQENLNIHQVRLRRARDDQITGRL